MRRTSKSPRRVDTAEQEVATKIKTGRTRAVRMSVIYEFVRTTEHRRRCK